VGKDAKSRQAGVESQRLPNTFAALSVAINDRLIGGLVDRFDLTPSDASALIILARVPQRIEDVSRQLGLTHSATVRVIDRLESGGLATRAPGRDKRSLSVRLTGAGKRLARSILLERERIVANILAELSASERKLLAGIVERLLEQLAVDWPTTMQICRLCNLPHCESDAPCPAAVGLEHHRSQLRDPAPSGHAVLD
jgi:DNA-binding MarR family transcriptional regulator